MQAKITFSNRDILVLNENQLLIPIIKYERDSKTCVSKYPPVEIWYHISDGFIPSIAEFLCNCEFFQLIDNNDKIYSSNAVVSIENI